jgi:ribosomal protein L11 methyltransferase
MAETYLVSVSVPREQAETFEALLSGLPGAIVGRRAPLIDTGLDLRDSDELEVLAYFDLRPDEADVQALLKLGDQITGLQNTAFAFETLPDVDWVAESQSSLTAIHAGRFFLHGSHDQTPVPGGACELVIDAQNAFGTGHHETTHGCLEMVSEIIKTKGRRRLNVLDMGTGSGVLGLAWCKATKQPMLGSDIDPQAVKVADVNARLNHVGAYARFVPAAGIGHRDVRKNARYEVVLANILSGHLINLAPSIAQVTAPGGFIVLAGLLRKQEQRVSRSFHAHGFIDVHVIRRGPWSILMMQNQRASTPRQLNRRCQDWSKSIDFH